MDEFNITLTIRDVICCKNCKDSNKLTTTVTIIIQNGIETIIRNIFVSSPVQLCLPCKCATHILTISGIINNT